MDKTYHDPCYGQGGPNCMESPCPFCNRVAPAYNSVENPIPKGLNFEQAVMWCAKEISKEVKDKIE